MTQATEDRQFTESELTAIVADRVQRETANITAEADKLRTDNTELANKLDAEISAKQAAEKAKADVEAEFEAYKKDVEEREQAAARKDERLKAVREAASHLSDDFFKDENRVKRIVAMDEDSFKGYVDDLKVSGGGTPKEKSGPPRETAMQGEQVQAPEAKGGAARSFLQRGMATATTAKKED
jgi:chromosome segregation ATPase